MTTINPDHLLEQAALLASRRAVGRPRQADLRRGISSAYYAAFHTVVAAAADQVVGGGLQRSPMYTLVARSIDHATIRKACEGMVRNPLLPQYAACVPAGAFGARLRDFMDAFTTLQRERHTADYDASIRYSTAGARATIELARTAVASFRDAPADERAAFVLLTLFPPRR